MCNKGYKANFSKNCHTSYFSTLFIVSNHILKKSSKMPINQKLRITHHSLRAWPLNKSNQIFQFLGNFWLNFSISNNAMMGNMKNAHKSIIYDHP